MRHLCPHIAFVRSLGRTLGVMAQALQALSPLHAVLLQACELLLNVASLAMALRWLRGTMPSVHRAVHLAQIQQVLLACFPNSVWVLVYCELGALLVLVRLSATAMTACEAPSLAEQLSAMCGPWAVGNLQANG